MAVRYHKNGFLLEIRSYTEEERAKFGADYCDLPVVIGLSSPENGGPDSPSLPPLASLAWTPASYICHTHALAFSGRLVEMDDVVPLMDPALHEQTVQAMTTERDTNPRPDATYDAQWIWDYYCQRHREKYGVPFTPDVDPDWDR